VEESVSFVAHDFVPEEVDALVFGEAKEESGHIINVLERILLFPKGKEDVLHHIFRLYVREHIYLGKTDQPGEVVQIKLFKFIFVVYPNEVHCFSYLSGKGNVFV
jgi:hypothetical protein